MTDGIDARPRKVTLALPLGYQKTVRWLFYTDTAATVPFDLGVDGWTTWELVLTRPGKPPTVIACDETAADSGDIRTVFPATLHPVRDETYLLRATQAGVVIPVVSGPFVLNTTPTLTGAAGDTVDVLLHLSETVTVIGLGNEGPGGPPGTDGEQGEPGADGLSAYEVAVANGFAGTEAEWLESLVGDTADAVDTDEVFAVTFMLMGA